MENIPHQTYAKIITHEDQQYNTHAIDWYYNRKYSQMTHRKEYIMNEDDNILQVT